MEENSKILTREQKQVLLSGIFGDAHIKKKVYFDGWRTNSIHREYIEFKKSLLGDLAKNSHVSERVNNGYKKGFIYCLEINNPLINEVSRIPIENQITQLDELGVALWFYDDGSRHKKSNWYNLNTHAFTEEVQQELFLPFFKGLGMEPSILKDRKKDGREFCYLHFPKHRGAYLVAQILEKYPVSCFSYKRWPEEHLLAWTRLKTKLKEEGKSVTSRMFGDLIASKQY